MDLFEVDRQDSNESREASFPMLNDLFSTSRLLGQCFELVHVPRAFNSCDTIFTATSGIYLIHCWHYHPEDIVMVAPNGTPSAEVEGISHYISYNAGTRLLQIYPEMLVLEQADVRDPSALLARLREHPYLVALDTRPNSAKRWVRQLMVKVASPLAASLPHSAVDAFESYCCRRR